MSKIKFTVDGKTVICEKGTTILEAALQSGIEIPNLCHSKNLKVYGACGVCSVEIKGREKLVRSCALEAQEGMEVLTHSKLAAKVRKSTLELLMSDHEGDCKGPCELNCPAKTDVQGYLAAIARGDYRKAVEIIKETNPLPASIGRICPHPCEKHCRRNLVEEPLSIAYLKAFAGDRDLESDPFLPVLKNKTEKSVGIIGAGPAGLAAAYRLCLEGHSVTVYDKMPKAGGMLRYGIPEYRLPKAVLDKEIALIEKLGVKFLLGEHANFDKMKNEHDAVLVAVGAWKPSSIGCTGEKYSVGGIDFLRQAALGEPMQIGKKVAVVGGGNTAMDACRTAVRLGAKEVYVIYRRTRAEAPAEDIEITEAMEEGVVFKFLTNPAEIIAENGKIKAVKLQIMELSEADSSGRRKPVPVEGKFEMLQVDTVISAIGQKGDLEGFEELALTPKGTVDAQNGKTNMEGVFAAGDITGKGAGIAIEAIAEGNLAAKAIDAYLTGKEFEQAEKYYSKRNLTEKDFEHEKRKNRAQMKTLLLEESKNTFDEVICGFSEEEAKNEANRCLKCGCEAYESCKLIKYANSEKIEYNRFLGAKHPCFKEQKLGIIERDMGKCILCNLCVRTCDEEVKKGILGLVGRGFNTFIKPEEVTDFCRSCKKCAEICPTGALKIVK